MYRHKVRLLVVLAMALGAFAALASAAQAANPAPGYERFRGCPTTAENPSVAFCLYSPVTGGHFQMGNKDVPITKTIPITGGVNESLSGFSANSEGGMKPVKQLVPGGVIGLTGLDWLVNFLNIEALQLFAVTELMEAPEITFSGLNLGIRVHLINPVLGNNCYVGSPSSPIKLHLIEGTTSPPPPNKPITGKAPTFSFNESTEVLAFNNGTYVDNSFSAPGANGCTLTLFGFIPVSINGLVNSSSGLPAAAGTNATEQVMDIEIAPVKRVYP